MVLLGVLLIFGGEAFCLLGPHTDAVHVGCHAVLYTGIALVAVGAARHWTKRLRTGRRESDEAGL